MSKNINICRIPTSLNTKFFRYWFEFLEPYHHLTDREIDVATSFLKQRYLLSKVIQNEDALNTVLMSEDTKKKIREECNLELSHFQVIMGKLKKKKVIIDGKFNKKFIPNVEETANEFRLIIHFELKQ